jgi:hypothetical protein
LKDGKECVQTCQVGANNVWYCDAKRGPYDVKPFDVQVPDATAPGGIVVKRCAFEGQGKWECRSVKPDPSYHCDLRRSMGEILCKVVDGRAPNAEVPAALDLKVKIPNRPTEVPLTCSENGLLLVCTPKAGNSRPLILMNGLDLALPSPNGQRRYVCKLVRGELVCPLKPKPAVSQTPLFYEFSLPTKDGGYEEVVCKDEGNRLVCSHDDLPTKSVVGGVKCSCNKHGLCSCVSTGMRDNNADKEFDILVPNDRDDSHEWVCVKKKRTRTVRRTTRTTRSRAPTTSRSVRVTVRRTTTKKCCSCSESHEHHHHHHHHHGKGHHH